MDIAMSSRTAFVDFTYLSVTKVEK